MRLKGFNSGLFRRGVARRFPPGLWVPFVILAAALAVTGTNAVAQTITSNGTGGGPWASTNTWVGGVIPDSLNCNQVIIVSGDSVSTNPIALVSCPDLDIQSGAKLTVFGPSTSGAGLRVKGAFTIEANAWFFNSYSSLTGWPANAASYSIAPTSNYVLTGTGSSTLGSSSSDSLFGNVYVLKSGSSCDANLTIQGNLTINTGAQGNTFRGIDVGSARNGIFTLVHHVEGDVQVISGQWSCVDGDTAGGAMTCVWNVDGNVTVGDTGTALNQAARMGPLTSAIQLGDSRVGVFNIGGNLTVINGARLQAGSSSGAFSTSEIGELNLKGDLTLDNTARVTGNSMGIYAINFIGNKPQMVSLGVSVGYTPNSGNAYPTLTDTIAAGATVVFTGGRPWGGVTKTTTPPANGWGAWVVNGTLKLSPTDSIIGTKDFNLNNGATLGIGSANGITAGTAAGDTVGNVLVSGTRTFSTGANYVYDGDSPQVTGDGLPTTVNDLTIDNATGVTLSQATTIDGVLHLKAGIFDNTIPFTLGPNGAISYEGGGLKVTAVKSVVSTVPKQFSLDQNFPNPFNPTTEIRFGIPVSGFVTLKVYDVLGRQVATLVNERKTPGVYEVTFDGSSLASGLYFYQVRSGKYVSTKRMMLIK